MPSKFHVIYLPVVLVLSVTLVFLSYERNGLWENPVILMNDVIQKSPWKLRSYNNLGYYYYKKGMLDDALIAFRVSLVLNPRYAKGLCNVGAVYVQKKSYHEAIPFLTGAVELEPDFGFAHFNLGLAYEGLGNRALSLEHFEKAAALGYAGARVGIARVLGERSTP